MRSRRTIILVLAVCLLISLCLNLFAGGAWLAGRWLDRRLEASIGSVARAYPPDVRRDVMRRLLMEPRELRAAVADFRAAKQRMFTLMRADPLDRNALASAMAEVRTKTTALQALLQSALAATLEEMPASERQKIGSPGLDLGPLDQRGTTLR